MKNIFYLLAILFLSLLLACSEEPPTTTEKENLSKKPVPPEPPQPLVLLDNANQIVGSDHERIRSNFEGKIRVWTYNAGYTNNWSHNNSGRYEAATIGDVDDDTKDELISLHYYETGNPNNRVRHLEIEIFESGNTTVPSRKSEDFSGPGETGGTYMTLGDANNDGKLEIVISGWKYIYVLKDDGTVITKLWMSDNIYNDSPWTVDVGNVDNDPENEIVFAGFGSHKFGVYNNNFGSNSWVGPIYSAPVSGALDRAKIADVDGDGANEVIGGGNYNKLTIWGYNSGAYEIVFESEDLGGYTQGIAAGDFDNDNYDEIAVGTATGGVSRVYVFKYNGSSYINIFEQDISFGVDDIFAGDSDNDDIDEFILCGLSLVIYKYSSEINYYQAYSDPDGVFYAYVK